MANKTDYVVTKHISIRNAKIGFRNFEGGKDKYRPDVRNFAVFLEMDMAKQLADDGWNVKFPTPEAMEDGRQPFIKVEISYRKRPPIIVLKTGKHSTSLGQDEIKMIDWAEIEKVDLIISPYNWEVNGKRGVKAFLKSIYVTVAEDEFAEEYRNVPDNSSDDDDEEPPF